MVLPGFSELLTTFKQVYLLTTTYGVELSNGGFKGLRPFSQHLPEANRITHRTDGIICRMSMR